MSKPLYIDWPAEFARDVTNGCSTVSDADRAKRIGCSQNSVASKRRELGILPLHTTDAEGDTRKRIDWPAEFRAELRGGPNTVPDETRARRLGCNMNAVRLARRKYDIPAFEEPKEAQS